MERICAGKCSPEELGRLAAREARKGERMRKTGGENPQGKPTPAAVPTAPTGDRPADGLPLPPR